MYALDFIKGKTYNYKGVIKIYIVSASIAQ